MKYEITSPDVKNGKKRKTKTHTWLRNGYILSALVISNISFGQVGVGTTTPEPSAQLEIRSTDKGLLIPKVELQSSTDNSTISNGNVDGLTVFNISTQNDVTPGYYYWNDSKWNRMLNEDDISNLPTQTSTLVDNNDGTYTYTDELGVTTEIDVVGDMYTYGDTLMSNPTFVNSIVSNQQIIDSMTMIVESVETVTSFVDLGGGNYVYTDENGTANPINVTGATGPAGPQGPAGTDGVDGIDGNDGAAGPQGVAGPAGPAGAVGPQGAVGPAGANGVDGIDGNDGAVGPQGVAGPAGPAGAVGPQGAVGPAGANGVDGIDGNDGAVGPQGVAGPAGPAGAVGPQGAVGPAGTNGVDGIDGNDGAVGPQGVAGPAGPAGAVGPQGAVGPAGANGVDGTDGNDGAVGPQGVAGPDGPQGPAGADGMDGNDGAVGPQGPAGPQGSAGADDITVDNGLTKTGTNIQLGGTLTSNTSIGMGTNNLNLDDSTLVINGSLSTVGIGTTMPDSSAQLDISSTTKGFLPPRLTEVQRDAIASPVAGLVVYNTDATCLQLFDGTFWDCVSNQGIAGSGTFDVGEMQTYSSTPITMAAFDLDIASNFRMTGKNATNITPDNNLLLLEATGQLTDPENIIIEGLRLDFESRDAASVNPVLVNTTANNIIYTVASISTNDAYIIGSKTTIAPDAFSFRIDGDNNMSCSNNNAAEYVNIQLSIQGGGWYQCTFFAEQVDGLITGYWTATRLR